jgi:hypothetical protein
MMKTKILAATGSLMILAIFLATSVVASGKPNDTPEMAAIRNATDPYQDLNVALEDGFVQLFDCTVNPNNAAEAMGQHYINPDRVDSSLKLTEPEVLMYEPQPDGSMALVAVEYIVFEHDWSKPQPPKFLGQTLKRKEYVGLHQVDPFFEVHAWVWKDNPTGVFADWNTDVSCQYE